MDSNFFLFLQLLAFFCFFYGIERDTWHGIMIFLSVALFFALSLAAYDIETTYAFLGTTGEIVQHTSSKIDITYAYLNMGLGLLALSIGIIKLIVYRDSNKNTEG